MHLAAAGLIKYLCLEGILYIVEQREETEHVLIYTFRYPM